MSKTLLGVIDATTYKESLQELTNHRSLAAVPIAGRYRLIDFILSSMVNSGISSVAIFPKFQYRSLMDHLGSGKNWELNRKRDGLFFFPSPDLEATSAGIGSFSHFANHLDYFNRSPQEYALIANSYTVANIDFNPVLDWHIENDCDITEIRHNGKSLHMFLLKTSLLKELIINREQTGFTCMRDIVESLDHDYHLCEYDYKGLAYSLETMEDFYKANLQLLNPDNWKNLFMKNYPIYTKVKDEPPTKYLNGSNVKNSMIANGCQIEGHVENSIIFRAVKIEKGTVIKNSIIMQKSHIGENCVLDSVILDKDVKIENDIKLLGEKDRPLVIRKGTVQGALMNS